MKRLTATALTLILSAALTGPALAGPGGHGGHGAHHGDGHHHARVDRRQHNQERRIERGIYRGELTRHEARRLHQQQRRIARLERRLRADGHLTRGERHILNERLERASRTIYRLTHNERSRHHGGHRATHWEHGDRGFDGHPPRHHYRD
jgi:hypothetical protein